VDSIDFSSFGGIVPVDKRAIIFVLPDHARIARRPVDKDRLAVDQ
jgi:hypothetical protein